MSSTFSFWEPLFLLSIDYSITLVRTVTPFYQNYSYKIAPLYITESNGCTSFLSLPELSEAFDTDVYPPFCEKMAFL